MNTRASTARERVFIQPDIRRRRITITVMAEAPGSIRLHIEGTASETLATSENGGPVRALLEFPDFECWSPEKPVLYTLVAEPVDGTGIIEPVRTRFGMREFTVKERRFALNSRPHAVRAAAFPLSAPGIMDGSAAPTIKAAGFNMLRVRGGELPRALLNACDEAGLYLWYEPEDTVALPADLQPYRNHPCLVAVSLSAFEADAKARVEAIRADDPSRLLIVPPARDGRTAHLVRPYHDTLEPYDHLEMPAPGPMERAVELHYQHNGSPDRLVFFGGAGLTGVPGGDGAIADALRVGALESVFGTPDRLAQALAESQAEALRGQLDAMRTNAKSAGYCAALPESVLTEPEIGPLRQTLRLAQAPLRMVIECDRTNITPREEVRVRVSLVNDRRVEGRADLSVQVVGPTKQVLWKKRRAVRITKGGGELWTGNLAASGTPGEHRIVARLMQGMSRVAETSVPLFVTGPPASVAVSAVMPLESPQRAAVGKLLQLAEERAPVFILPPIANSIRAYPPEFVSEMLGEVAAGAVALVFSPPSDWNDLAAAASVPGLAISPVHAHGDGIGVYHYGKRHPVFEDLPARGLLGAAYRNLLPATAFRDESEQDIAGCLAAERVDSTGGASPWRATILVKRHGEGRIVFTDFRLLENIEHDPVAARMLVNMAVHFASRAVPAEDPPIPNRDALRWLGQEQSQIRRWMVLGMFPNFGESGHDTAYPPEEQIDLNAVYPGWYNAIGWKRWYSLFADDHVIDLAAAAAPGGAPVTEDDYGTAYAYAEFNHPQRDPVFLHLLDRCALKCWLNGRLVYESRGNPESSVTHPARVDAVLRQGKNTLLLKVSKTPGPAAVSVDFEAKDGRPLNLRWWR